MPTPTPIPILSELVAYVSARLSPVMVLIFILVLTALFLSLWRVYSPIKNKRATDLYRKMLYDAVYESRYRILKKDLMVPSVDREYEGSEWIEKKRNAALAVHEENKYRLTMLKKRDMNNMETISEMNELEQNIIRIQLDLAGELSENTISKLREKEEKQKRKQKLQEEFIHSKADREAKSLVPPNLTVTGMGDTGAFFIELTAILTIIFVLIILGLVGVLGTHELVAILGAIAGYVLGKTTSRKQPS